MTQSVDERILKIDAALEAAAESDVLTALESADTALKRAYGLLLERISAVLLLEALAASNVLYSTDYCRGMHSAPASLGGGDVSQHAKNNECGSCIAFADG